MRPWALHEKDVSTYVPLLSQMRNVYPQKRPGDIAKPSPADAAFASRDAVGSGVWRRLRQTISIVPPPKQEAPTASVVSSYVLSWMQYIDGNVVSEMSRRFISDLMSATAARIVETAADIGTESDDSENEQPE